MLSRHEQTGRSYIAGIFLADDDLIVRVADAAAFGHDGIPFDSMMPRLTARASGHLRKDLAQGFRLISKAISKEGSIKSVGIAIPGPFQGSGTVSTADADILTTTFHRRGRKWEKVNLRDAVRAAIKEADVPQISVDVPPRFLPDAAAYALGEYTYALHEQVGNAIDDDLVRRHFRNTAVYAHLTIDEGIAGAVIAKGGFFNSRLHAEIGHIPVRRHPRDPLQVRDPPCKAHKLKGCAEAYVALPALRARWPNVENELSRWRAADDKVQLIAYYIAQICNVLVLVAAPSRIYLSGRVVRNPELVDLINRYLKLFLTIPNTDALYPGYEEQRVWSFVQRRPQTDVGVYGCLIEAGRMADAADSANVMRIKEAYAR